MVTDSNQILCHGSLTGDNAIFVIALDNLIDGIDLCVHLIVSRFVFRCNHHQPVPACMEQGRHILRHDALRDAAADVFFIAQRILDAVHMVDLIREILHIRRIQRLIHNDKMEARHAEILRQPVGTGNAGQCLRQTVGQRVIDIG